jgi:hypothetical protein
MRPTSAHLTLTAKSTTASIPGYFITYSMLYTLYRILYSLKLYYRILYKRYSLLYSTLLYCIPYSNRTLYTTLYPLLPLLYTPYHTTGKIMRRILRKIASGEEDSIGDVRYVCICLFVCACVCACYRCML